MPSLLGLDSGLTMTKAVLFDIDGTELATARRRVPQSIPRARHVERDMDALWEATADAIAELIAVGPRGAEDIVAIAATAHGDGLCLLDGQRRPLGPGILSLDSRAGDLVSAWAGDGTFDRALAATGQVPHASAPSALLAWIRRHEPGRFAGIGHVLACKDWLRFRLTGTIGTDRTEASTAFADVRTQGYAAEVLSIFGLDALAGALPPIAAPSDIIGAVTAEAAARTGLGPGTPVAAGLHDVTASALGVGGHRPGAVDIVAGTYSINEIVSDRPVSDARWFCRSAIAAGTWNAMSISPASTTNYDWMLDALCRPADAGGGGDIHELLAAEIRAALKRASTAIFHPFLFGAPHGPDPSGGFFGLHGWHDRGDMLRAVLEGIAFNHRTHVDALREGFVFKAARLSGGVSRNPDFAQLMADVLDLPVTVSRTGEAAALGAALCAGAGAGLFESPFDDPRDVAALSRTFLPDPARHAALDRRYGVYLDAVEAMRPLWPKIEALGREGDGE